MPSGTGPLLGPRWPEADCAHRASPDGQANKPCRPVPALADRLRATACRESAIARAMRIILTTDDLNRLVHELQNCPYIALDTEFMRDQTYWPKLCLIQVAAPGGIAAIIDPLAADLDLSNFFQLLATDTILKVFHAGRQDIEIFFQKSGVIPHPIFDTQIAAMVCGFGEAAAYETLARKLANAEIDKSARFTDWSRRPLSARQLEYALADVTHLCVVYEKLEDQLKRTGRHPWVEEEVAALQDPALYRLEPKDAWKRLKARSSNKRFLAMLAAVSAWREREAQSRDTPRSRVLKDEALLELASHPPQSLSDLERFRAIPKGFAASRLAKGLIEAIEEGRHSEPPTAATHDKPRRKREPSPSAVDLLKTLLRLRAESAQVAPRLIANADDVERLAAQDDDGVAALHGWRAKVFGNDALALREGRIALTLEDGNAVIVEIED